MQPDISSIASLIGDKARSKMLLALLGGKALTATELALHADITPQTASSHLAKLLDGELIVLRKQGRHRYFQLKNHQVATLLEQLLSVSAQLAPQIKTGPEQQRLRQARVCYDHLAGELGVVLYNSWVAQGWLEDGGEVTRLTEQGEQQLQQKFGLDLQSLSKGSRPLCKSCLDWSERTNHLAGKLGSWVLQYIFDQGWAQKDLDCRAIRFSHHGLENFQRHFLLK